MVFTGGIGENSPEVRRNIAARLEWMGLQLDDGANAQTRDRISAPASQIEAMIIPTDEEIMIAQHTRGVALGIAS